MKKPLITIITVVYNGIQSLENTILSVINQTYPNIEYIIQDGGSVDGTIDIIKKYETHITAWISKSDKGIYDAMNKSIINANGEWINFMNSGDSFVDNYVIEKIFEEKIFEEIKILYGNVHFVFDDKKLRRDCSPNSQAEMPSYICHQATFIRTSYIKKHPFDISLKICADFKLVHDYYKSGGLFLYTDVDVANYDIFGFSYQNLIIYQKELNTINGYRSIKTFIKTYIKSILCRLAPATYKSIYYNSLRKDSNISLIDN